MSKAARTVLDALVQHLRACASTADGLAAPAAILWTDPEGQWRSLAPAMLQALPELLVFGAFDPAQRTGPAIWLRCMVDRTLPEPALPADRVPIVYLPGVSRQGLSTGEECQRELQPLVELMFRGVLWLQKGGHDWTVSAFLTSPQALGLDVARDAATRSAMLNSLRELAMATVAQLQRGRLEANDFYQLLTTDPTRDLLRWMSEPDATKGRMESDRWSAFCALCRERFGLDPDRDGVVKAGGLLGEAEGPWADVWTRYEEAPASYAGIPELLRKCRPSMLQQSHWPQRNDKEEQQLGEALRKLAGQAHAELCAAVLELDRAHAPRRQWVWSRLQQAPLAGVIERLAAVAGKVQRPLGGSAPDEIAQAYANGVWRADAAAWQALAVTPVQHEEVVRQVVQALLAPWAADSAQAFQAAVARMPTLARRDDVVEAKEGGCLMFVDGLRYDLGCLLDERLAGRGCRTEMRRRWAALPTVTATGKPAVTPVGGDVTGQRLGEDFAPSFRSGRGIDAAALRTAIANKGYQLVGSEGGEWPARSDARGFLEFGNVDSLGHERQEALPGQLEDQLERLCERVVRLLEVGWQSVRIVTDHGWLFLPAGLPKVDLPKFLTLSRWARCAVVAGDARVDVPRVAWHWNGVESVAVAPGITCFNQSPCYAHGGISIQECLTPDLLVTRSGERRARASIKSITWRGMRCMVEAEAEGEVRADLRLEGANGPSVVKAAKLLEADGGTSLVVADDRHERSSLTLVLLAADNTVLAQQETRVGATS